MKNFTALFVYAGITLLTTVIIVATLLKYNNKCKNYLTDRNNIFRSLFISKYGETCQIECLIYNNILVTAYARLKTYFMYQVICKAFGITSLLFSAVSFVTFEDNHKIAWVVCCIIAILSVIVVVYINPLDRARGYLASWRKWNKFAAELFVAATVSKKKFYEVLWRLPDIHTSDDNFLSCDKN